ncbi:MAG: T9SS type A sorting domain-containing protein [Cytophagaceae bacterium]
MKTRIIGFILLFLAKGSFAQISGIINTYTQVTAVDLICNKVTVGSTAGFAVGDRALMIQMQGAVIDQTQAATFGDLTGAGIAGAGNYEFVVILAISGNDIYFKNTILYNNYDPTNGSIQLITVPQYTDVTITGTLTAQAWNGTTGGVLVFEASGIVTLNANIDVSGIGFRGGLPTQPGSNASGCPTSTTIYYEATTSISAGWKGEGATKFITGKEAGRGKSLNGGGGGRTHNSGGGGGGNYGSGGRGGDVTNTCSFFGSPFGLGGYAFTNTNYNNVSNKVFMGGGGGGGQQNNNTSFPGANGGGIVIIRAGTIEGNAFTITANGNTALTNTFDGGDGAGGGGGGGAILLSAGTYPSAITATASGGNGGGTNPVGNPASNKNFGPGGGGGGGVVWINQAALPPSVTSNVALGNPGISTYSNTSWGAAAGTAGSVLTGLVLKESSTLFTGTPCITTPVELISFEAKQKNQSVTLAWSTASEKNNNYFVVERSSDLTTFDFIANVSGAVNSGQINRYSLLDKKIQGSVYYRLSQVDLDGKKEVLGTRYVNFTFAPSVDFICYPNPFNGNLNFELNENTKGKILVQVVDAMGSVVYFTEMEFRKTLELQLTNLPSGLYTVIASDGNFRKLKKVIKE